MHRGFILQATYKIEAGIPVILIYGKLESGGSFLIRDTRQIPSFYIRQDDAELAVKLGAVLSNDHPKKTFRGEVAVRVETRIPQDVPSLRERLAGEGVTCFEADVPFASRYLINRGIRGSIVIRGDSRSGEGVDQVFENPEVLPADWSPVLSILSIDIETNPDATRLLSVALANREVGEVLLFNPKGYTSPTTALPFESEKELLQNFVRRVRELDPDVITGWNVVDFDLATLLKIAERCGVSLTIGRGPEPLRIRPSSYARAPNKAVVSGRVALDGIELLRGSFVRLDSYSLDSAAREILGRGKIISGPDRADEILKTFKEDRERFVEYNLNDARLALEILEKLNLPQLAVERSRLTGMPPDRVSASIASFDFLYLSELERRGIVAPTAEPTSFAAIPTSGGHVLEPLPGLYSNVLAFDFRSLYPSIIRTFQIDPLGHLPSPAPDDNPIVAPNGAAFRRERGILPGILDDLIPRRASAVAAGDKIGSHAIKILMNSFYGVLGTPACRFASPELANAITGFGRELLLWSKARFEGYGYKVLYGDTDSLFVLSGATEEPEALQWGMSLATKLNCDLSAHIRETWGVDSKLELRFERLYLRFFLAAVRHGNVGARKRYAGLVREGGRSEVVFTGMEAVRRDWTDLAKQVQREIYLRLFSDLPVDAYLREIVRELRAGLKDQSLVYRKAMRKDLDSYVASTPPHIAAARKASGKKRALVEYVITVNGPEPVDERTGLIDYEHYVQKQIRAVAEPVLSLLGLNFDRVIGDEVQLRLF